MLSPHPTPERLAVVAVVCISSFFATANEDDRAAIPGYPETIQEIDYPVPEDESLQPALFHAPETDNGPFPLLVAMHTWSGDHRQGGGEVVYARWCLENEWIFLHPNFRGPNRTPEAMGSDLVIADIRAAIEWAKENSNVDESRIYAIGVSGGGHATQLLAGRMPDIWAGISSWCGISDIAAWHAETGAAGRPKYARDIEKALGGPPDSPERHASARRRSPLHWLSPETDVPLDLNHGIDDGRTGSVPFTHSLHAWNTLVEPEDRLSAYEIERFYQVRKAPETPGDLLDDPLYGSRRPLFRRVDENVRITIFDGGHEIVHRAALNWLAAQRRGEPVNWNPPLHAELPTSEEETRSGK